jgi:hypothetical protein
VKKKKKKKKKKTKTHQHAQHRSLFFLVQLWCAARHPAVAGRVCAGVLIHDDQLFEKHGLLGPAPSAVVVLQAAQLWRERGDHSADGNSRRLGDRCFLFFSSD